MAIKHNNFYIWYLYSYLFRPREVIIRVALEHFKRLLSMVICSFFPHVHLDLLAIYLDVTAHCCGRPVPTHVNTNHRRRCLNFIIRFVKDLSFI